jgi:DNA-binding IclR family transcriptional regulator
MAVRFTEVLRQVLHRYSRPDAVDITQSDIAEEFGRNRATIHSHCSRLVELGYLRRHRQGQYEITADGRAALDRRQTSAARVIRCPSCNHRFVY